MNNRDLTYTIYAMHSNKMDKPEIMVLNGKLDLKYMEICIEYDEKTKLLKFFEYCEETFKNYLYEMILLGKIKNIDKLYYKFGY
jgi:hypothetical protein